MNEPSAALPSDSPPSFSFTHIFGQGKRNQLGGVFINGRPLPHSTRVRIVEMARQGIKPCQISRQLKVSHGAVSKILTRFAETGSVSPGQMGGTRSRLSVQSVEDRLLNLHDEHPEASPSQLRQLLIDSETCTRSSAPTQSSIASFMRRWKKERRPDPRPATSQLNHSIDSILGISFEAKKSLGACSGKSSSSSDEDSSFSSSFCDSSRRSRTSFTAEQLEQLETAFRVNSYPDQEQREALSAETLLPEDKITTWFSNRRARSRKNLPLLHPFLPPPHTLLAPPLPNSSALCCLEGRLELPLFLQHLHSSHLFPPSF